MVAIYRWHVLMVCYTQLTCFDGVLYTGDMFNGVLYRGDMFWWCAIYRWHALMVCYIQVTCFNGVLYTSDMFWWCAIYRWHVLMVCYIQLTCFDGVLYTGDIIWCVLYTTDMFWRYATQLTYFPPEKTVGSKEYQETNNCNRPWSFTLRSTKPVRPTQFWARVL